MFYLHISMHTVLVSLPVVSEQNFTLSEHSEENKERHWEDKNDNSLIKV